MKNMIILGAGTMQAPAIQSARELGFFVTVLDANPDAPAVYRADRFECIDISDADAVCEYALKQKKADGLSGIFTAGTDFSVSVSRAAQECGLPAHSYEAACNASDKVRMRTCFADFGVPSPEFLEITPAEDGDAGAARITESLNFPFVVKPVDNMGARGCRMVRTQDELIPALHAAAANSRSGRVIVEEYMDGPEFSVDAVIYNGTLTVCGFADRHIFYPPYFIEMGHTMPTSYNSSTVNPLIQLFAAGVMSLGLTCGAAKGDLKLTSQGPMIGEIAARLSGGYMSGWTYPYASDFNLTKEAVKIAGGLQPDELERRRTALSMSSVFDSLYEVPCTGVCAERAWISIPGTVRDITGIGAVREQQGVKDVFVRADKGDAVSFPRNNVQKCGNVIALAPTRAQAVAQALHAAGCAVIRLETRNELTDAFLSGGHDDDENGFPPDAFVLNDGIRPLFEASAPGLPPIPKDTPALSAVPEPLAAALDVLTDWNSVTLRAAVAAFDALVPQHREFNAEEFWRVCLRGSVQGMLYYADSY